MAISGLAKQMSACFNSKMAFPGLGDPGLPNFAVATLTATQAGITYVLPYLPPNPFNPPPPPSMGLFSGAFSGASVVPTSGGAGKLMNVTVKFLHKIFTDITLSILALALIKPSTGSAISTFKGLSAGQGFDPNTELDCIPIYVVKYIDSNL